MYLRFYVLILPTYRISCASESRRQKTEGEKNNTRDADHLIGGRCSSTIRQSAPLHARKQQTTSWRKREKSTHRSKSAV
jgi:hypothetical protein